MPDPLARLLARLCCGLFAVSLSGLAGAQTAWFVDASASLPGDGSVSQPFQLIQSGLDASATSGDTVRVLTGIYAENLILDGKSVELTAASGLGSVSVDGGGLLPGLRIRNHPPGSMTTVRGLRFENGAGEPASTGLSRGGGLYVDGWANTAFDSCEFTGNSADEGGGAYLSIGSHSFVGCAFDANIGQIGGGLHAAGTDLLLQGCSASNNLFLDDLTGTTVPRLGIGIALMTATQAGAPAGASLIEDCTVRGNFSVRSAGGIGIHVLSFGPVTIRHTSIADNGQPPPGLASPLGGSGGGIRALSDVTVEQCTIVGNGFSQSQGGGLFGNIFARDCVISDNVAADGGGAYGGSYEDCLFEGNGAGGLCCVEGAQGGGAYDATLVRCVLRGNRVFFGPVMVGAGAARCDLQECTVEFNFFGGSISQPFREEGGGLFACHATDTIIRGNSAPAGGGAAQYTGVHGSLVRCTITGNRAFEAGGGIAGSFAEDCILADNVADGHGGGAVDSTLLRCTIYGNEAGACGGAAGCALDFCTVTGNRAMTDVGGAGATDEFPPYLGFQSSISNSIVYANEPSNVGLVQGPGPASPSISAEWSLIQGGWPGIGNLDADGQVTGPYSGNAQLLSGSPAIDAADPAASLDPDGTRADMGAIPFDPTYVAEPSEFCTAKASSLGTVPQFGWSGSPTLSGPDDFTLLGTDLNGGSFALVAIAPSPAATQAFGGTICLGQGLVRLAVLPTGGQFGSSDGAVAAPLRQAQLLGYGSGALLYAQGLVRDPNQPDGSGAALTAGLEFRILP